MGSWISGFDRAGNKWHMAICTTFCMEKKLHLNAFFPLHYDKSMV
jgi:hypothetical protein